MPAPWKLTVRAGPRVDRERFASFAEAIAGVARLVKELEPDARRQTARALAREIAPGAQVAARLELSGPGGLFGGAHGGIDLRGDGSSEAWTGRVRKEVVALERGETAVDGLARALAP